MWRTPAAVVEDVADVTVHAEAERRREAQRNKLLHTPTWCADERGEGSRETESGAEADSGEGYIMN